MGEFYTEQLVKQKATLKTMIKKSGAVVLSLLVLMVCFISIAAVPLFMATVALTVFLWKRSNLEFEYLYYAGEIDIDKIMGRQKRKRVFSGSVKTIDLIAPTESIELQQYKGLKSYDCSSNSGNKTYEMVLTKKDQKVRVIFEPKEEILKHMKMYEPRKIIL